MVIYLDSSSEMKELLKLKMLVIISRLFIECVFMFRIDMMMLVRIRIVRLVVRNRVIWVNMGKFGLEGVDIC